MAKNTVVQLTIKANADLREAQAAFEQLGKTARESIDVKSSKNNSFVESINQTTQKLATMANTANKTFSSSKGAKDFQRELKSINQTVDGVEKALSNARANPNKYFTSGIQTSTNAATESLKGLKKQIEAVGAAQARLKNLSGTATGKNISRSTTYDSLKISKSRNLGDIELAKQAVEGISKNKDGFTSSTFNKFTKGIDDKSFKSNLQAVINDYETKISSTTDPTQITNYGKQAVSGLQAVISDAILDVQKLKTEISGLNSANLSSLSGMVTDIQKAFQDAGQEIDGDLLKNFDAAKAKSDVQGMMTAIDQIIDSSTDSTNAELQSKVNNLVSQITPQLSKIKTSLEPVSTEAQQAYDALADTERAQRSIKTLTSRIEYFFSLQNGFRLISNVIRSAFQTVQELDAAMTETAVVTDYSVDDMWGKLDQFTDKANELGATTLGAYETMTLYYQQGLNDQEAWDLGTETMKMARIANMEYTEATDAMTAALRGFNMELNQASAQKVNDVYSKLAAVTASDTEEIATAMSKVASLASMAGMDLETTATYLSQAIETTREAPENIGTAMKTILARFTSLTKDPDTLTTEETEALGGETVDANVTEAALAKAGVALRDETGQIRDAKSILLELNEVWSTLDSNTQHYIATQAAGSRQQSRFIAMMSDYAHTQELLSDAQNSSGAAQEQFDKTLESLEAKLNKLENAWNEFVMGLANSDFIKQAVDLLTKLLTVINNLTGSGNKLVSMISKWALAFAAWKGASKILSSVIRLFGADLDFEKIGVKGAASLMGALTGNLKKLGGSSFKEVLGTIIGDGLGGAIKTAVQGVKGNFDAGALKALTGLGKDFTEGDFKKSLLSLFKQGKISDTDLKDVWGTFSDDSSKGLQLLGEKLGIFGKTAEAAGDAVEAVGDGAKALDAAGDMGNAIGGATKLGDVFKNLLSILKSISPWLIAITAAIAAFKLMKWLGVEGQLERTREGIEALNDSVTSANNSLSDIESNWDSLTGSDLGDLKKGTWEWQKALLAANNQVNTLLEKYPELIKYTSMDENGELIISEEGLQTLSNNLMASAQKAQNASLFAQANEQKLLAGQLGSSKGLYGSLAATSSGDKGLSAEEEVQLAEYKALQKQYTSTAVQNMARNASSFKNTDSAYAQTVAQNIAQAFDENSIEYDDSAITGMSKAELEQYLKNANITVDDEATKEELTRIAQGVKTSDAYEEKIQKLVPIFDKISGAEFSESLSDGNFTWTDLKKWLESNGVSSDQYKGNLSEIRRYVLQSQGLYDEQTYENASGLRQAKDLSSRTEAFNKMMGTTGTDYEYTEKDIEDLWSKGVYQGIASGNNQALQDQKSGVISKIESNISETDGDKTRVQENLISDEELDNINKMLDLTGKEALSAKTVADNWDAVKEALSSGDNTQVKQLQEVENLKNQLTDNFAINAIFPENELGTFKNDLNDVSNMLLNPSLDIDTGEIETKLNNMSDQLSEKGPLGVAAGKLFRNIATKLAAIGGKKIKWKKKGKFGIAG